jgi:cysteinyl-tRNA synthetase
MYVCGITPYATTHLGHAFTYAAAAVLIRYLEDQGYLAHYVQTSPTWTTPSCVRLTG